MKQNLLADVRITYFGQRNVPVTIKVESEDGITLIVKSSPPFSRFQRSSEKEDLC